MGTWNECYNQPIIFDGKIQSGKGRGYAEPKVMVRRITSREIRFQVDYKHPYLPFIEQPALPKQIEYSQLVEKSILLGR